MNHDSKAGNQLPEIMFTGEKGQFKMVGADQVHGLYFPLANEAGIKSSITPELKGDIKLDQNHFLLTPVTIEDLRRNSESREFWFKVNDSKVMSISGQSPTQKLYRGTPNADDLQIEAGFLWHKVIRTSKDTGLKVEVTNFCPAEEVTCELMQISVENIGNSALDLIPFAAIPIFGRSADNLRDHRHVTSLLNVVNVNKVGVCMTPGMAFDERGHMSNDVTYSVLGIDQNGKGPERIYPTMNSFTGKTGTLDWPEAVFNSAVPFNSANVIKGSEALGGLQFSSITLKPGEKTQFYLVLGITPDKDTKILEGYLSSKAFKSAFSKNERFWGKKLDSISITTSDPERNNWLRWVTLQPVLRRMFGNSFLPHFDYGRGGRGWRDLWQDCLALMFTEPQTVKEMLINNFSGIRIDGTNATIIGANQGEFNADRNNIPRVWMDHGVWPSLTTRLYIDVTGNIDVLLIQQTYYRDHHINRCKTVDQRYNEDRGNRQLNEDGVAYQGSILEHILIQLLTAFYNVGQHNILKLEDADWNDGLDMARENGESVAFSAMYAHELIALSTLLESCSSHLPESINLLRPMELLVHTDPGASVNYNDIQKKTAVLDNYVKAQMNSFSTQTITVSVKDLAADLQRKGSWLLDHIQKNEWLEFENEGWFNGYYDNKGQRLDRNSFEEKIITLTGQVFPILSKAASETQTQKIIEALDKYLWNEEMGGYRLNSNLGDLQPDMGRAFAFAYGHKENGAMFSHMAVMLAFALYERGYHSNGFKILDTIYKHCIDTKHSRIYPGIPEYFDDKGKGLYSYLTGSASWYLYTLIWQVFGVQGTLGDLLLKPKLNKDLFNKDGIASITLQFAQKTLVVNYKKNGPEFSKISTIKIFDKDIPARSLNGGSLIDRSTITALKTKTIHINVTLR